MFRALPIAEATTEAMPAAVALVRKLRLCIVSLRSQGGAVRPTGRATPSARSDDVPADHHRVVLMHHVVAVHDVASLHVPEAHEDTHFLVGVQFDYVLARVVDAGIDLGVRLDGDAVARQRAVLSKWMCTGCRHDPPGFWITQVSSDPTGIGASTMFSSRNLPFTIQPPLP